MERHEWEFFSRLKVFNAEGKSITLRELRSRFIALSVKDRRAKGENLSSICNDLDLSKQAIYYHLDKQREFLISD